jgi:hypothetical protein
MTRVAKSNTSVQAPSIPIRSNTSPSIPIPPPTREVAPVIDRTPTPIYTTPVIPETIPLTGPKDIGTPTLVSKPNPIQGKRRVKVDSIELSKPRSYQ